MQNFIITKDWTLLCSRKMPNHWWWQYIHKANGHAKRRVSGVTKKSWQIGTVQHQQITRSEWMQPQQGMHDGQYHRMSRAQWAIGAAKQGCQVVVKTTSITVIVLSAQAAK